MTGGQQGGIDVQKRARERGFTFLVVATSLAIASAFYLEAHSHRVCCDALDYWRMADAYRASGIFADHPGASLRTYLYPSLLALVTALADAMSIAPSLALFALQFALYVASSLLLARSVAPMRGSARTAVFTALACNPFALAYLPVALTDTVALSVFNVWLAAVIRSHARCASGSLRDSLAWFAIASACAGGACALRPAYVWLLALTPLLALVTPEFRRSWRPRIAIALLAPLLALAPQMAINQRLFATPTPLPTVDLGNQQVRWGIENLKYATAPKPGADARMFYSNPFVAGTLRDDQGLEWYFHHPLRGAATVAVKLVGAFDFDYVTAYVWDRDPPLQILSRALSLLVLVVGALGMIKHAGDASSGKIRIGPTLLPVLVFVGWSTVTLVTAVELRFTLPVLTLLIALAARWTFDVIERPGRRAGQLLAAILSWAALAPVAAFVASRNVLTGS